MTSALSGAPESTKAGVITTASTVPCERSLLIVEDDKSFLQRLARAMETRGFTVTTAESVADGLLQVEKVAPAFAVVDMRLGDGNGLDVISAMKKRRPEARAIILTGTGAAFSAGYDQAATSASGVRPLDPKGKSHAEYLEYWQRHDGSRVGHWVHMWSIGKPVIAAANIKIN